MAEMGTKLLNKYESIESVVFLDQRGGMSSSDTTSPKATRLCNGFPVTSSPLTVAVTVRRGRVFILLVVMTVVILGLTFTFTKGVELSRFEASSKDSASRDKLLNNYNSYSGIIASAFAKPIEIVITALAQIITLRFMAQAFTQPDTTWKQSSLKLALSVGVGYLVSNGFNALNVQLRTQEVHPVITEYDLAVAPQNEVFYNYTTSVAKTHTELSPGNLISNTVLRNAVLPRVAFQKDICNWANTQLASLEPPPPLPAVNFGFSRRDWQNRFLLGSLEPQSLQIVVNATNKTVNEAVKSADLPMDASTAADLVVYAMLVAPKLFPWGDDGGYYDKTEAEARRRNNSSQSFARVVGLLPPTERATETAERDWFLKALPTAVTRQFNSSENTSRSNIGVEFSHVDITSVIKFDAVTFEVDVDPSVLSNTTQASNSSVRYTKVWGANKPGQRSDCGPWPALCLLEKPIYKPNKFVLDPPQQVQVFSSCVNTDGTTQLMASAGGGLTVSCETSSTTSMMVLSIGRRFIADSLIADSIDSTPGGSKFAQATITNLRYVYTFTIGRLSWQLEDLAAVFHAECSATAAAASTKCLGLQVPLALYAMTAEGGAADRHLNQQHLVVSADALPTSIIVPSTNLSALKPRGISLVEVSQYPYAGSAYGEVLLPHNVGQVDMPKNEDMGSNCDADVEGNIFTRLNNHFYIEHSFQVAYTAATFFLLQDGVARVTVLLSGDVEDYWQAYAIPGRAVEDTSSLSGYKVTLNFNGNTQDVVVWVSTPLQNGLLTIAGCAILVICLFASLFKRMGLCRNSSIEEEDPLSAITSPQAIARIMLDEAQFPALLLHRRVVNGEHIEDPEQALLDQFAITEIAIHHQGTDDHFVAVQ